MGGQGRRTVAGLVVILGISIFAGTAWAQAGVAAQDEAKKEQKAEGPKYLEVAGNRISLDGFLRFDGIYSDSRLSHMQYSMWARREDRSLGDEDDDESIDMHPRLTRLGLTVQRDSLPRWEKARMEGRFEMDFQNRATSETEGKESESRQLPRLRHAYIKLASGDISILIGQTSDLIAPLWPSVNADALMWNSGNLGDRRPQLRFSYEPAVFDVSKLQLQVALARTGAVDRKDLDNDNRRDGDDSGKPMVQFRAGLASLWEKRIDVGLWGHRGWEETNATVAGEDDFTTSSFGLDFNFKIAPEVTLSAELFQGKNLADLRGGIGQGVNATTGDEIAAKGGWIDIAYKWTPWYTLAVGYGQDAPDDGDLNDGDREKNRAFWIGNKFDVGGGFAFGLEYINWDTDYKNQGDGDAHRFNMYAMYKF